MISTLPGALDLQSRSCTDTDRSSSKQRFVEFELDRSRDSRRRHRVVSSARRLAALFHQDGNDRQSLRSAVSGSSSWRNFNAENYAASRCR